MSPMSCQSYLPLPIVRAFVHRFRLGRSVAPPFGLGVPQWPRRQHDLLCPLLTSAPRSGGLSAPSVPSPATRRRSPEVSSTAFAAHPPDLQLQALDGYGLRGTLPARPTRAASYPVSVRRVAALLHASFRPRLAATPLRFANTSPPSGCVGDFHPQAVEHARHTTNPLAREGARVAVGAILAR